MIEVYGRDGCSYCEKAVNLLEMKRTPFTYFKVGKDLTVEELLEKFPGTKTVPIVVVHGMKIGGYSELAGYIEETTSDYGHDI